MSSDKRRVPSNAATADAYNIREEPGWVGWFSRGEAPGAIKNGRPIVKTVSEAGDRNPVGTKGVVLGSIFSTDHGLAYWVEWDHSPRHAIFIVAKKIAEAS